MCNWLSTVRSLGHTPDMYCPGRYNNRAVPAARTHGEVCRLYESLLLELNAVDFDGILFKASFSWLCMSCSHD